MIKRRGDRPIIDVKQLYGEKARTFGMYLAFWVVLCMLAGVAFKAYTGYPFYFFSFGVAGAKCVLPDPF